MIMAQDPTKNTSVDANILFHSCCDENGYYGYYSKTLKMVHREMLFEVLEKEHDYIEIPMII